MGQGVVVRQGVRIGGRQSLQGSTATAHAPHACPSTRPLPRDHACAAPRERPPKISMGSQGNTWGAWCMGKNPTWLERTNRKRSSPSTWGIITSCMSSLACMHCDSMVACLHAGQQHSSPAFLRKTQLSTPARDRQGSGPTCARRCPRTGTVCWDEGFELVAWWRRCSKLGLGPYQPRPCAPAPLLFCGGGAHLP